MTATLRAGRPLWASVALTVRTGLTAAALTMLVGLGALSVMDPGSPSHSAQEQVGLSAGPLHHLMTHNRCSYTGFDQGVVPSTAIVRDGAGNTRLVSFDTGWAVFTGKRSGELVAVCLGPERATPARPS